MLLPLGLEPVRLWKNYFPKKKKQSLLGFYLYFGHQDGDLLCVPLITARLAGLYLASSALGDSKAAKEPIAFLPYYNS